MSKRFFAISTLSAMLMTASAVSAYSAQKPELDAQVFVVRDSSILHDVHRSVAKITGVQKVAQLPENGHSSGNVTVFTLPASADAARAVRAALASFKPVPVAALSNSGSKKSTTLSEFVGRTLPYTSRVTVETLKNGSERQTAETSVAREGLDITIKSAPSKDQPGFSLEQSVTKLVGGDLKTQRIGKTEVQLKSTQQFSYQQEFSVPEAGRNVVVISKGLEAGDFYVTVVAAKQAI